MKQQQAILFPTLVRSAGPRAGGIGASGTRRLTWPSVGDRAEATHVRVRDRVHAIQFAMLVSILLLLQALLAASAFAADPTLSSVLSRKTHGAAGTFDLVLSSTMSNPSTEPRYGGAGGNHLLVFVFNKAVTSGTAAVTEGIATVGTPSFSGNEMLVPLSGVGNAQYVTIAVSGVNGSSSGVARVGFLIGDANASRSVTTSDSLLVNAALSKSVTSTNFLCDVNVSGTLSIADNLMVNAHASSILPPPGGGGGADTTAPTGSVVINGGTTYTNSPSVTLTLSATDAVGVTGYWLSIASSPAPSGSAVGWTSAGPATSYNANVPYTFAFTSDGPKTVYAWYKDAAGNVSALASASITLDHTAPVNGNLTATASTGMVSLGWSGFSDSGSGLASNNAYTVVSSTAGSPASCTSGGAVSTLYTGNATSYTHTAVTPGTTYYYRVCAKDNAGNIDTGATANATPQAAQGPVAKAGPDQIGSAGTSIYFDGSGSSDPAGSITSYKFVFGDGLSITTSNAGVVSHVYSAAGTYTMTLTVTNAQGLASSDSASVTVVSPTTAQGNYRSARSMGGTSSDTGNAMAVASSGTVVTVGAFQGSADFGGTAPLTSAGGSFDFYIAEYTSTGQYLCSRRVGGIADDSAYAVKTDASGNIVVAGTFQGTVDFGGQTLTSTSGSGDAFVAKYAPMCGPVQWVRGLGSSTNDAGYGIAIDRSGDVIVTGYFSGSADFGAGLILSNGPFADAFVAKYAGSNGAYQWAHTLYGPGVDIGRAAAVDTDGNIVVTGSFQLTVSDGSTYQPMMTTAGSVDIYLIKYSSAGAYLWWRSFGGTGDELGYSIDVDGGGNIAIVGSFQNSIAFGGTLLTSAGLSDMFVAKFSPMGNHLWSKSIGGTGVDVAYAVAMDAVGSVVVTGGYQFTGGQWDILVNKYSASGSALWSKSFGSTNNDVGLGTAIDGSGNVYVTGYLQGAINFGGGLVSNAGAADAFLLSLTP